MSQEWSDEEEEEEEEEEEKEEYEWVKWEGECNCSSNCLIETPDKKPCSAEELVAVYFSPGLELLHNRLAWLDNATVDTAAE